VSDEPFGDESHAVMGQGGRDSEAFKLSERQAGGGAMDVIAFISTQALLLG